MWVRSLLLRDTVVGLFDRIFTAAMLQERALLALHGGLATHHHDAAGLEPRMLGTGFEPDTLRNSQWISRQYNHFSDSDSDWPGLVAQTDSGRILHRYFVPRLPS